jgi:hypothetical protein
MLDPCLFKESNVVAPHALLFTRNVLEAEDLSEMLRALRGWEAATCRDLAAALELATRAGARLQMAFVTPPVPALEDSGLLIALRGTGARIVVIDLDAAAAGPLGVETLARPFTAEQVRDLLDSDPRARSG